MFLERPKCLRVAEEAGDADQKVAKEGLHIGWVLLQVSDILFQPLDLVHRHAPFDAPDDGALFVLRKIVTGLSAQQQEDLFQRVFGLGGRRRDRKRRFSERVRDVGDELGRHLGRRQHIVHQARGDSAARHAVVFGGFGVLCHRHAAFALDRPHPLGTVTTGP